MGFDIQASASALTVFIQGILSFFSPCVFPLIPIYIGYLSGGAVSRSENGEPVYNQRKVLLHTVFFVLGISFAFFLLGLGASAIGIFFNSRHQIISQIGGGLILLFGLYQLGVFGNSALLSREKRLSLQLDKLTMSPLTALLMGFLFSFAWTPCVGPVLTSVLIMAAAAESRVTGFLLIGLYTLGFVIPFLAVGAFSAKLLSIFKKHRNIVKYTMKIGGVLMVLVGILMISGKMNNITGYFARISSTENTAAETSVQESESMNDPTEETEASEPETNETEASESETNEPESQKESIPAVDFSLTDQYGNVHTLADYSGKTIFLNFWATWCPPCRNEMPDIQKLSEIYPKEGEDAVVFLGVAAPGYGNEGSVEEITAFLEENGYTYPVLMDTEADLFKKYQVYSYPTTFMIDSEGNIFGYITGQLSEEIMIDIIDQTRSGIRRTQNDEEAKESGT